MSNTARTPWPQRPNPKTSRGRAAQRMILLERMEQEMLIEEREGLQMTEEQRQSLLSSFALVKTEFCDLDGLSWSTSLSKDIKAIEEVLSPRIPSEITNSPSINSPRSANSSFAFNSPLVKPSKISSRRTSESKPHQGLTLAFPDEGFPNSNCYGNPPLPVPSTPSSAESTVTIKACPSFPEPHTDTGPACSLPNLPVGLHPSGADDTCASHFSSSADYTAGTPLTRSPSGGRALSHLEQPRHAGPRPSTLSNKSSVITKGVQSLVLDLPCPQYCGESEATRDSLQPDLGDSQEDIFRAMSVFPHLDPNDSSIFSGLDDSPRTKTRRRIPHIDGALSLLPNTPSNSPFLDTYSPVTPVALEERTSEDLRSLPNHIREWATNVVPSVDA